MSLKKEELDVIKTLIKKRIIKKVEQEGDVATLLIPTSQSKGLNTNYLTTECIKYDNNSLFAQDNTEISFRTFLSKIAFSKRDLKKKIKEIIEKYNILFEKKDLIYDYFRTADEFNPFNGTPVKKMFFVPKQRMYELTNDTIEYEGHILYRIKALQDFNGVKKGDLGGYIESEKNLNEYDGCWVSKDAKVLEDARVSESAKVLGKIVLRGDVHANENAKVYGTKTVTEGTISSFYIANPKYELTNETIEFNGKTLYRIRALYDFGDVKAGDLGGFVESEENLSQIGDCWIYDDAKVIGDAKVINSAKVRDHAIAAENARIADYAEISEYAYIGCATLVTNHAKVYGHANIKIDSDGKYCEMDDSAHKGIISDAAEVGGYVSAEGYVSINGNSKVSDNVKLRDFAEVSENSIVSGNVIITNNGKATGHSIITDNVIICESGVASKNANVSGNVIITNNGQATGCSKVSGHTIICNDGIITDNACADGKSVIGKASKVCDNVKITDVIVNNGAKIYKNIQITGITIQGNVNICDEFNLDQYMRLGKIEEFADAYVQDIKKNCKTKKVKKIEAYDTFDYYYCR